MTGFRINTPILMGDNTYKNIQDIQINDMVMSYDEIEKIFKPQVVVDVMQPECSDLVEYVFSDGTSLVGCRDLNFLTISGEYKTLEAGDQVVSKTVEGVSTLLSINDVEGTEQLYELDIEDIDNFIVNNIVVHNAAPPTMNLSIKLSKAPSKSLYLYRWWDSTSSYKRVSATALSNTSSVSDNVKGVGNACYAKYSLSTSSSSHAAAGITPTAVSSSDTTITGNAITNGFEVQSGLMTAGSIARSNIIVTLPTSTTTKYKVAVKLDSTSTISDKVYLAYKRGSGSTTLVSNTALSTSSNVTYSSTSSTTPTFYLWANTSGTALTSYVLSAVTNGTKVSDSSFTAVPSSSTKYVTLTLRRVCNVTLCNPLDATDDGSATIVQGDSDFRTFKLPTATSIGYKYSGSVSDDTQVYARNFSTNSGYFIAGSAPYIGGTGEDTYWNTSDDKTLYIQNDVSCNYTIQKKTITGGNVMWSTAQNGNYYSTLTAAYNSTVYWRVTASSGYARPSNWSGSMTLNDTNFTLSNNFADGTATYKGTAIPDCIKTYNITFALNGSEYGTWSTSGSLAAAVGDKISTNVSARTVTCYVGQTTTVRWTNTWAKESDMYDDARYYIFTESISGGNISSVEADATISLTLNLVSGSLPTVNSNTLTYGTSTPILFIANSCGTGGTLYCKLTKTDTKPSFNVHEWLAISSTTNIGPGDGNFDANAGTYYLWYYIQVTNASSNDVANVVWGPLSKTINKAQSTITYSPTDKTISYWDTINPITITAASSTSGSVSYTLTSINGSTSTAPWVLNGTSLTTPAMLGIGTYTIGVTISEANPNYTSTSVTKTFKLYVMPEVVDINTIAKSKTYGDAVPTLQYSYEGVTRNSGSTISVAPPWGGSDNLTITLTTSATSSSAVGTYDISATCNNRNYELNYSTATKLTITAKAITINAVAKSKTYGATDPTLQYTYNGTTYDTGTTITPITGQPITVTVSRVAGSNAGTYTISLTTDYDSNTNYSITKNTATFTINKAASSISLRQPKVSVNTGDTCNVFNYITGTTPTGVSLTYAIVTNGTTTASTISGSAVTAGAMSSTDDNLQSVVVRITNPGNSNYNSNTKDFTIEVNKLQYSLSFFNNTSTIHYGDTLDCSATVSPSTTISYSATGVGIIDRTTGSITLTKDVGIITVTATAARTTTYAEKSITRNVTVDRRPVNFIPPQSLSFEYIWDGQPYDSGDFDIIVDRGSELYYYQSSSSATPTFNSSSWTTTAPTVKEPGTYYIWVYAFVEDTTRYIPSHDCNKAHLFRTITILKRTITLTWPTNVSFPYTGSAITLSAPVVGNTITGYNPSISVSGNTATNVGDYTATVAFSSGSDAHYALPSNTSKSWSITKVAATLPTTWIGASIAYHNTATVRATGYGGGTIYYRTSSTSGSGYGSWSTTKPTRTAVGSTYVQCYIKGDSNHTDSPISSEVSITVTKATDARVTVSITERTYNGSSQIIADKSSSEGVSSWTLGYSTTSSTDSSTVTWSNANTSLTALNAGTYYIWYKFSPDSSHSNSKAATYVGSVVMSKRANTAYITASAGSFVYGNTPPTYTYSDDNLVSGHVATHGRSGAPTAKSSVGSYTVTATTFIADASGTDVTNNYTITNKSTTVSVAKRELTVTANSASIIYGSAAPSYTVNYSNWANNDNVSSLSKRPTCSCDYDIATHRNAGTYAIVPSGAEATNYKFKYVNGTLTVQQLTATLNWGPTTWKYDAKAHSTSCAVANLIGEDDFCTVTLSNNGVGPAVGQQTVTATALSNDNYKLGGNTTKTLTITPVAKIYDSSKGAYIDVKAMYINVGGTWTITAPKIY